MAEKIPDILNSHSFCKKIVEYSASENTDTELIRLSHVKNNQIYDGDF